jgi:hypothetical protein
MDSIIFILIVLIILDQVVTHIVNKNDNLTRIP